MKIRLINWHSTQTIAKKIEKVFPNYVRESSLNYIIGDMTLDEFYKVWDDKFLVYPNGDAGLDIAVTNFSTFNAR